MSPPPAPDHGSVVDLETVERELRQEPGYERSGHAARTLARTDDLRVVLIAIRAGGRVPQHRVDVTASIHVITGRLHVGLPDRALDLAAGQLALLGPGLEHDICTESESAFVLTLGWTAGE